jgi:hypothetical protein
VQPGRQVAELRAAELVTSTADVTEQDLGHAVASRRLGGERTAPRVSSG